MAKLSRPVRGCKDSWALDLRMTLPFSRPLRSKNLERTIKMEKFLEMQSKMPT